MQNKYLIISGLDSICSELYCQGNTMFSGRVIPILEEEQFQNLAQRQPLVWSASDFIILASTYEGRVTSPLTHRLIFPLTAYSQCNHHSWVG